MISPSDLDLSALLEKLSNLDSKLCDRYKDGYNVNCYSASGDRWMTVCLFFDSFPYELSPKPLAYITAALQQAIAAYPNLCYQLQPASDGVHASIWSTEDEAITFDSVDRDAAIALLSAYVQWLEAKAK